MLDKDGDELHPGDKVRAGLTQFDGPVWMFNLDLKVVRLGRTKVHVGTYDDGDRTWAVTPKTLKKVS